MARLVLMLALCVLPAIVAASRQLSSSEEAEYDLEGRVYCDTCQCGYENAYTKYIHGAEVKVVCSSRKDINAVLYEAYGKTDKTGTYIIRIKGDQKDNICDVKLVSSPVEGCNTIDTRRDRSRVTLSSNNGIVSNKRFANALGFTQDEPMSGCTELIKQLESDG